MKSEPKPPESGLRSVAEFQEGKLPDSQTGAQQDVLSCGGGCRASWVAAYPGPSQAYNRPAQSTTSATPTAQAVFRTLDPGIPRIS